MTQLVSPKRVALAGAVLCFAAVRVRVLRSTSSFAGKKPGTGHRRGQLSGGGRNRRRKPGNNFRTSFAPSDEDPGAGSIYAFDHATPHYVHDGPGRWEPGDLAGREGRGAQPRRRLQPQPKDRLHRTCQILGLAWLAP